MNADRSAPDDVYNLLKYDYQTKSLGLELRQLGYDIVVLNFPMYNIPFGHGGRTLPRDGGTDYMERNAMVLIKLINMVNDQLTQNGSTEKIVVVGPSMGGQISRYALKYMENNNMNHNCRLWTAFDSPNLGANVPVGNQALLWYAGYILGNATSKSKFDNSVRSYASRQLTIYQTGGDNFAVIGYYRGVPAGIHTLNYTEPMRPQWQQMINFMGYPTKLRKIAVINGSMHGSTLSWLSGSVLLAYSGKKAGGPLMGTSFLQLTSRTVPNKGANCNIFEGIVHGGPDAYHYWGSTGKLGSLEYVPGGVYNSNGQIHDNLPVGRNLQSAAFLMLFNVNVDFKIDQYAGDWHTFIPTISSLGFYASSWDWSSSIWRNLVCSPEIPFDDYFAPSSSQQHIAITPANASWIKNQVQYKGTAGPRIPEPKIQTVYNGFWYTSTITFPDPPPDVHYSWSVTYNTYHTFTGNDGGSSWGLMDEGSSAYYTVTVSGICNSTYSKTLHLHNGILARMSHSIQPQYDMSVSPNPANDAWLFSFDKNALKPTSISIIDITGKHIYSVEIANGEDVSIPCNSLSMGVYNAIVHFSDGSVKQIKVMRN